MTENKYFEIVEAPKVPKSKGIQIFIAGGISNCPYWQSALIEKLQKDQRILDEMIRCHEYSKESKIIFLNPRRKKVPPESETKIQITWEFNNLNVADIICFWFSEGSPNPIVLFEYARLLSKRYLNIVVGCHENYVRRMDVVIQTELVANSHTSGHHFPKVHLNFDDFYEDLINRIYHNIVRYTTDQAWKLKDKENET